MRKSVRASLSAGLSSRTATIGRVAARLAFAALLTAPVAAGAQAWAYPSFQPPRVMNREFNFGIADAGDAGTSLMFQWREGLSPRTQLSFDAGFADPDGEGNGKVLLGGQFAGMLTEASADMPLDFLLTG